MVMTFTPLILSGKTAPRLGLGTWALGGGKDWGESGGQDAADAVHAALDAGICLIDTAPAYGWGRAEELLARALKGRRQQVLLADKCGIVLNKDGRPDHDLRPESILAQCDASLSRLQTDYLDIYLIHWPDPKVPLSDALGALERLKEQGKIRALGLCNVSADLLLSAAAQASVACVQNPLSLLDNKQEKVLAACAEKKIPFMAYGALGGGILSGKYHKEPNFRRSDARRYFYPYYRGESFSRAQGVAARVKELAAQKDCAASAVALAWALGRGGVSGVLFGARCARQVQENAAALQIRLTEREAEYLEYGH